MTDAHEPATPPRAGHHQRLMLDVREVRDRMRLRSIASVPALGGGLWLLWIADNLLLRVLALAGVVFAVIWMALSRRHLTQLAHAADHYLDISPTGLTIQSGTQVRSLAWSDIAAVEIDEDRLAIRLRVTHGAAIPIEPQYGALGLRELAEMIERARTDSAAPEGVRSPQS